MNLKQCSVSTNELIHLFNYEKLNLKHDNLKKKNSSVSGTFEAELIDLMTTYI